MKKILIKIINISIIFAVALSFTVFTVGAEDYVGSLAINLSDKEKNISLENAEVSVYKIADFVTFYRHEYMPDERFVSVISKLDFSTLDKTCTSDNSKIIADFIKKQGIKADKIVKSDNSGQALFENVEFGIYLVEVSTSGEYTVDSFLTEVPLSESGVFTDEVTATPKIGKVETPKKTPKNDKKGGPIPQTGQLRWPVPVMLVTGLTFIILGYADYCHKKKQDLKDGTQ